MSVSGKMTRWRTLAERFAKRQGLDDEDGRQVAMIGIIVAARSWDVERGNFDHWAFVHARRELQREAQCRPVVPSCGRKADHNTILDLADLADVQDAEDVDVRDGIDDLAVALLSYRIDGLDPMDQTTIRRRLAGDYLTDIGAGVGVSRERARQISVRAVRRLGFGGSWAP